MTTYFKQINENNELVLLLTYNNFRPNITNSLIVEITQDEYEQLLSELQAKAQEEAEQAEQEYLTEQEEKAAAYDVLMGVSE